MRPFSTDPFNNIVLRYKLYGLVIVIASLQLDFMITDRNNVSIYIFLIKLIFRTPLPKDKEMELKAEQTAREIEQVSYLLGMPLNSFVLFCDGKV